MKLRYQIAAITLLVHQHHPVQVILHLVKVILHLVRVIHHQPHNHLSILDIHQRLTNQALFQPRLLICRHQDLFQDPMHQFLCQRQVQLVASIETT